MQTNCPRLVLAGTNSGCGKTTVSCALLQALVNRGLRVGAFKCGPDYIDPMFHSSIIGAKSANLDPFFFSENTLNALLADNGADREISIIEGVMGFYDGIGMEGRASTWELSQLTRSPVVLVVGARGASLSVLAVIQGFLDLMEDNRICGVILNRCSPMLYPMLAKEILRRFGGRVQPLGCMPELPQAGLESRHLGLITAQEVEDLHQKLNLLAAQAEKTLDIPGLLALAARAEPVQYEPIPIPKHSPVRIAVAKDRAFCFYYADSLRYLERMGAQLVEFSPLEDAALPEKIGGLYLGGGYPELYAARLSANASMLASIRRTLEGDLPCIAECGGFMYLTQAIGEHPMVGFLPGACRDTGHLVRFGYVTLTAREDNLLCDAGQSIPAHEFHHWDCDFPGEGFTAAKLGGRSWSCAVTTPRLYAGYPHFHFYANPQFAERFYNACLEECSHD